MHPQLTDKRVACKDFIEALEQCHINLWAKLSGGCNDQKLALNSCLRKERLDSSAKNREKAKVRAQRRQEALEDLHKDD